MGMNSTLFQLQQTVQEVLEGQPKTRHAFKTLKTQCIGCHLSRFCTLQDVATAYEITPDLLLKELSRAVRAVDKNTRSTQ
jgi:hypothetical protein